MDTRVSGSSHQARTPYSAAQGCHCTQFHCDKSIEDWVERTDNEKRIQGSDIVMQTTRDAKITASVNEMKRWSYEKFVSGASQESA